MQNSIIIIGLLSQTFSTLRLARMFIQNLLSTATSSKWCGWAYPNPKLINDNENICFCRFGLKLKQIFCSRVFFLTSITSLLAFSSTWSLGKHCEYIVKPDITGLTHYKAGCITLYKNMTILKIRPAFTPKNLKLMKTCSWNVSISC